MLPLRPSPDARRSRAAQVLSLAALTMLVACGGTGTASTVDGGTTAPPELVLGSRDVAVATMQPIAAGITVTGSLDAAERVQVTSQIAGMIERIAVDRGTPVRRGQFLAAIDARAVGAQVASAQAALASAERDLSAADTLYKAGALSERDFVQARVGRDAARAQVAQVREMLSRGTITSPITGVVSERLVEPGEVVQVASKMFTIVNTTALELAGRVAPDAIGGVRIGQPVQLSLDAYPGRTVEGRVARIEPVAETGTRQVAVYVRVPNGDGQLVAGLFATGTILRAGASAPVLTVPGSAVRMDGDIAVVFAILDGRVVRTPVVTGQRDPSADRVEIRSGLSEGTRVVLDPSPALASGTAVRLFTDSTATAPMGGK